MVDGVDFGAEVKLRSSKRDVRWGLLRTEGGRCSISRGRCGSEVSELMPDAVGSVSAV
jgi:hypothetical protein